jgi:hypothetical protein
MTSLRQQMDRLWDRAMVWPDLWAQPLDEFGVAVDVAEDDKTYTVKASVPGAKPEDIEVTLANEVLTIKGEAKEDKTIDKRNYQLRERRYGSFLRRVALSIRNLDPRQTLPAFIGITSAIVDEHRANPHSAAVYSSDANAQPAACQETHRLPAG